MNPQKVNNTKFHQTSLKSVKPYPIEVNPTSQNVIGASSKSRPPQNSFSSNNIEGLIDIINSCNNDIQKLKQQIKQIESEVILFLISFSRFNSHNNSTYLNNKEEYVCCNSYNASDIITLIKNQFQICISTILSNFPSQGTTQDEEKQVQVKSSRNSNLIMMRADDFSFQSSKQYRNQKDKDYNSYSDEIVNESEFKESISIATDFIIEKLNFCMNENVFSIENEEKFLRDLEQIKEKMLYSFEGNSPKDSVKTISQIENA